MPIRVYNKVFRRTNTQDEIINLILVSQMYMDYYIPGIELKICPTTEISPRQKRRHQVNKSSTIRLLQKLRQLETTKKINKKIRRHTRLKLNDIHEFRSSITYGNEVKQMINGHQMDWILSLVIIIMSSSTRLNTLSDSMRSVILISSDTSTDSMPSAFHRYFCQIYVKFIVICSPQMICVLVLVIFNTMSIFGKSNME